MILSRLVPRLHEPIQCLRFATYLENAFLFLEKSQNIMASINNFLRLLILKLGTQRGFKRILIEDFKF